MRSARKISIICFLTMVLTLSIVPMNGYSWTHDDNFGENYQPGINAGGGVDNGDRVYYNGYRPYPGYVAGYAPPPPPPYPYAAPPPYYYGYRPPVQAVIPFPVFAPGFYYGHHYRHWR